LIASVERAAVGDVELFAVSVIGVEDEGQTFGGRINFVDRAAAGAAMLVVECFGIQLPGAEKRITFEIHRASIL
jgi:hypothetical protein